MKSLKLHSPGSAQFRDDEVCSPAIQDLQRGDEAREHCAATDFSTAATTLSMITEP